VAKMTEGAEFQPRQACSNAGQAVGSTARSEEVTSGTHSAPLWLGSMTSMAGAVKVLGLLVMAVVPGGLLALVTFMLVRAMLSRVRLEQGTAGQRFTRAFAAVRWRDVWTSAKQGL
jgi:hypothetical protein